MVVVRLPHHTYVHTLCSFVLFISVLPHKCFAKVPNFSIAAERIISFRNEFKSWLY